MPNIFSLTQENEIKRLAQWAAQYNVDMTQYLRTDGTRACQYSSGSQKFGNVSGGNYSELEADGTYKANGAATTFNDLYVDISPRTTGVGKPSLSTFLGNIQKYIFAVNDITELGGIEFLHDWKEGSPIDIHVHWATGGLNNATVRGVKWEVDYTWANIQSAGGTIVFPVVTTVSVESSIAANEPALTHKYTSITSFTPTGGKINAGLTLSLKRIASVTNVAPAAAPFALMVGVHYERDTLGSRSQTVK